MKRKYMGFCLALFIVNTLGVQNVHAETKMDDVFRQLNSFVSTIAVIPNQGILDSGVLDSAKKSVIIENALQELGKPYVYGSSGPDAYDCSGFTSYIFLKAGIQIPRVSVDQGNSGNSVEKNMLLPGDLIFFDTRNSSDFSDIAVDTSDVLSLFELSETSNSISPNIFIPKKVTHVGIYISDGKFIHASSGSEMQIMISDLNNKYYNQRYLFAKRYP
ncbi:MAG: C40 family peptidase [Proteocatella sp.]